MKREYQGVVDNPNRRIWPNIYYLKGKRMRYQSIVVAALALLASAIGLAEPAHAQAYPCGGGPGPGERQVGTMGGSHGIAETPMCEATWEEQSYDQGPAAPPRPTEPEIPIKNFIAVATHPKQANVWATWGQYRLESAEAVVLDACEKTMGDGCTVLKSGYDLSVAVGRDKKGQIRAADGTTAKQAKSALNTLCKSQGLSCKTIHVFDAPGRSEPILAGALLREDFDKSGLFKEYYFPPNSRVAAPKVGIPDVGVGIGAGVASNLPVIPGIKNVHYSINGAWLLRAGDRKGLSCSLTYLLKDQQVLFFGPTKTSKYGALMLTSDALPATSEARETSVTMTGDRGAANVRVFRMPTGAGAKSFLIMPTDIVQTIASISDKSPVKIVLDGRTILDMQIEGGLKARSAMQQCMARR